MPVATRRRDGRGRTAVTLLMVGVTALLGSAAGTVAAHTWKLPQLFVRPSATASVRNARMDSGAAKASTTSAPPSFAPPAGNDASRLRKLAAAKPRMRTAAQTLAVARYRIDADEGRLTDLRRRLDTDPHATLQSDGVEMLLEGARDPTTALAALEVMASLPGSQGPDLIYEVWVSAEEGSRIRQVADELLHSHDVYKKSSNALKVVSDLSEPHDCQEYPAVLKRAGRQGDQRARAGLRKLLLPRNECGANGKQDCHRCIPKATLIKALNDCTQRKPPQL